MDRHNNPLRAAMALADYPVRPELRQPLDPLHTLGNSPYYLDAVETLLNLRDAKLTLATQARCRQLQLLVDDLACDAARESLPKVQLSER